MHLRVCIRRVLVCLCVLAPCHSRRRRGLDRPVSELLQTEPHCVLRGADAHSEGDAPSEPGRGGGVLGLMPAPAGRWTPHRCPWERAPPSPSGLGPLPRPWTPGEHTSPLPCPRRHIYTWRSFTAGSRVSVPGTFQGKVLPWLNLVLSLGEGGWAVLSAALEGRLSRSPGRGLPALVSENPPPARHTLFSFCLNISWSAAVVNT